jgi:aryl-phospho-beta-D-glucosidase BglC (GH1 family)
LSRLHIVGNQFVTAEGIKTRLKSVNWFGMESTNYIPHGCWVRRWVSMLSEMKAMGFNCIRLPFSGDICTTGRTPPGTAFDTVLNPEFVGKTSLQILDLIVDWCQTNGMYIVLDHHRCYAGAGTDSGIAGGYTEAQWHADWVLLATRYASNTAVVGADLHNEPYVYTWAAWKALVEPCAEAILVAAPAWLIFVEGVGAFTGVANGVTYTSDNTWWGGQLLDVWNHPISLSVASKVVYSPHEYGQSVGSQAWLSTDSSAVAGYPAGIYTQIHKHWGWIYETNLAPIWVGEMGGKFGLDGSGGLTVANGTLETTWMNAVIKVLNGDFLGNGTNQDTAGNKGMSAAYWGYPPVSGDTGGLLEDDWVTEQTPKLTILAPFLTYAGA